MESNGTTPIIDAVADYEYISPIGKSNHPTGIFLLPEPRALHWPSSLAVSHQACPLPFPYPHTCPICQL